MGGETRYNKDSIFHLERQRGITSEAHSDGQQADDAEIAQDGRLRRVPGILPVRVQDELHGCVFRCCWRRKCKRLYGRSAARWRRPAAHPRIPPGKGGSARDRRLPASAGNNPTGGGRCRPAYRFPDRCERRFPAIVYLKNGSVLEILDSSMHTLNCSDFNNLLDTYEVKDNE